MIIKIRHDKPCKYLDEENLIERESIGLNYMIRKQSKKEIYHKRDLLMYSIPYLSTKLRRPIVETRFKLLPSRYTAWNKWVMDKLGETAKKRGVLGKLPLFLNPKLSDDDLNRLAHDILTAEISKRDNCGLNLNCNVNRPHFDKFVEEDDIVIKKPSKKDKKEKSMVNQPHQVKVNWKQSQEEKDVVYFSDLGYEPFRIKGCSAVYLKVHFDADWRGDLIFDETIGTLPMLDVIAIVAEYKRSKMFQDLHAAEEHIRRGCPENPEDDE